MKNKKKTKWARREVVDLISRNQKRVVIAPIANPVLKREDRSRLKKVL